MALAVLILSTEGGRNSLTSISSSPEEAKAAKEALECEGKFLRVDSEQSVKFMARAWQVMENHLYEEL